MAHVMTLAEIRNGTGFDREAKFLALAPGESEEMAELLAACDEWRAERAELSAMENSDEPGVVDWEASDDQGCALAESLADALRNLVGGTDMTTPGTPSKTTIYRVTYRVAGVASGPRALSNRVRDVHPDGSIEGRVAVTQGYSTLDDAPKILAIVEGVSPSDIEVLSTEEA